MFEHLTSGAPAHVLTLIIPRYPYIRSLPPPVCVYHNDATTILGAYDTA